MTKTHNYDQTPIDGTLRPLRDLMLVRELPVELPGLIQPPIDLNRSREHSPYLWGIVEAVGPKVMDCRVGDKVYYPIGCGEFRVPGDDMVRIMREDDITGVEEVTSEPVTRT